MPTLLLATAHIAARFPQATLLLFAADNIIDNPEGLQDALHTAARVAQAGPYLVSLGIPPTYPSTAYGYMQRGPALRAAPQAFVGRAYIEKPDAARAIQLIDAGDCDWNSGMFVWDVQTFFAACDQVAPAHAAAAHRLRAHLKQPAELARIFAEMPCASVDDGLLGKLSAAPGPHDGASPTQAVQLAQIFVRANTGWDDVGSFVALARHLTADPQGNRCLGAATCRDAKNTVTLAAAPFALHLQGVDDLMAVVGERGDLMIASQERAAELGGVGTHSFVHGLHSLGQPPQCTSADPAGNALQGACRVVDSTQCTVRCMPQASVTLLGVHHLDVQVEAGRASVSRSTVAERRPGPAQVTSVRVLRTPSDVAEAVAAQLVRDLKQSLDRQERPAVVLSSGKTPLLIYALLRERYARAIRWDRLRLLQMDEYSGLPADDPRLFRHFLQGALVGPLGMAPTFLTGQETGAQMQAHEAAIRVAGGIDLVLHGVGTNGHLGFNEPGTPASAPSRQVDLAATTQATVAEDDGAAGFPDRPVPKRGVSMGLSLLLDAKTIHVVALGQKKAAAMQRGLCQPPGEDSPLSWVQRHPHTSVFLDLDACAWLSG